MKEIIFTVGLPGSCKTTIAQSYIKDGYTNLNRDIEKCSIKDLHKKLNLLLHYSDKFILDNTYTTLEHRDELMAIAKSHNAKVTCIWVKTSFEDCQRNLRNREAKGGLHVPTIVMNKLRKHFVEPNISEGYDIIEKEFVRDLTQDVIASAQPKALVTNASGMKVMPAICFDFDGTVRRSKSGKTFIQGPKDIELMPNIEKLIWKYRDNGYLIFGVSNQGGVAHGFRSTYEVNKEFDATLALFDKNPFQIIKYCFNDAKGRVEPYCYRSLLRKPDIGMLAMLEVEAFNQGYIVDWDNSIFVGDRPEDAACAANAGIQFIHIDQFLVQ